MSNEEHQYRTKSGRIVKKNQKFNDDIKRTYGLHFSVKTSLEKFGEKAEEAIKKELMQMINHKVFHAVSYANIPLEERRKIIRSHMFIKEKFLPNGDFEKIKARLVADGRGQDAVHDSEKTSPTVSVSSIFLLAAIAGAKNMSIATMDVPGAYLKASMPKGEKSKIIRMKLDKYLAKVYCNILPKETGFMLSDGSLIVELDKALYGCIESAKLWYETLRGLLHSIGFICNAYDKCVFQRKDHNNRIVFLSVYVDDIMLLAPEEDVLNLVLRDIQNILPDITIHNGRVHNYLGMVFNFNENQQVMISMDQYIKDFLADFDFDANSGSANAPGGPDLFSVDVHSKLLEDTKKEFFHSSVAKLLYLAKRIRPDLLVVVSYLTTKVQCPTQQDFDKLLRCVRYIRSTPTFKLSLSANFPINLCAYVDSAYAVHGDYKSHSGMCISLGRGMLLCKSTKQRLNVKSSTEAELVGLSDSLNDILWMHNFMSALGFATGPTIIYHDNLSVITMLKTGFTGNKRSRHVNVRFYFAKDYIERNIISLVYKPSSEMVADVLSKPLGGRLFKHFRAILLGP